MLYWGNGKENGNYYNGLYRVYNIEAPSPRPPQDILAATSRSPVAQGSFRVGFAQSASRSAELLH